SLAQGRIASAAAARSARGDRMRTRRTKRTMRGAAYRKPRSSAVTAGWSAPSWRAVASSPSLHDDRVRDLLVVVLGPHGQLGRSLGLAGDSNLLPLPDVHVGDRRVAD